MMLHAAQSDCFAPTPYAMTLHRERAARLERISSQAVPQQKRDPAPAMNAPRASQRPTAIVTIYPAYVFLEDIDREPKRMPVSIIRDIQRLVCQTMQTDRADLLSARRQRPLVMARQVAMYLCKRHTSHSYPEIGRRFGGRDHTTVLHAIRRVAAMMNSPMGSAIGIQWQAGACDAVRHAVNLAEVTISTWGEDAIHRCLDPGRQTD